MRLRRKGWAPVATPAPRPAHRLAADPAAPLRVSLSIKVSDADKAAYAALPPLARAAVRARLLATLRAALAQEEGTNA